MDDYVCAGIIPYRKRIAKSGKSVTDVLMGVEWRKKDEAYVWNFLSGRREATDSGPEETAVREFWEESGKCFDSRWCDTTLELIRTIKPAYVNRSVFYFVPEELLFSGCGSLIVEFYEAHTDKTVMQKLAWICSDSVGYGTDECIFGYRVSHFMRLIWKHLVSYVP